MSGERIVKTQADGKLTAWKVLPTQGEACSAGGVSCHDQVLGLSYFSVLKHRTGRISLDDIDEALEEQRYTWEAEMQKVRPDVLEGSDQTSPAPVTQVSKSQSIMSEVSDARKESGPGPDPEIAPGAEPQVASLQAKPAPKPAPKPATTPGTPAPTKPASNPVVKPAKPAQETVSTPPKHSAASPTAPVKTEGKPATGISHSNPVSVWGQTFIVPGRKVGQGSFHFLEDGTAYLNYEIMPKTQDGTVYPKRMDFRDIVYNAEERSFKGTLDWKGQNTYRWDLQFEFDEKFMGIQGTNRMYRPEAKLPYCTLRWGVDCYSVRESTTEKQVKAYMSQFELDPDTKSMIDAMGTVVEKDNDARTAAGRGKATAVEGMQLIFGNAMQTFIRDKKADESVNFDNYVPKGNGAKLGRPTKWDRK